MCVCVCVRVRVCVCVRVRVCACVYTPGSDKESLVPKQAHGLFQQGAFAGSLVGVGRA